MQEQWAALTPEVQFFIVACCGVVAGVVFYAYTIGLSNKRRFQEKSQHLQQLLDDSEADLDSLQTEYDIERDARHAGELTITRLESAIEAQQALHQARIDALNEAQRKLEATFDSLAANALTRSNNQFLSLAQEQFKQYQQQAKTDIGQREVAIQQLVQPMQQALEKAQLHIQQLEQSRKQAYGSISEQVHQMAQGQIALKDETSKLVTALRRPEVRGQWGEITLRRLVELAGMTNHCDFIEQPTLSDDEGKYRPDMIINMPSARQIIIDVKTPLDAYISAVESSTPDERTKHLNRHLNNIKQRIKELSNKTYWSKLPYSPEFVLLFIPGEQFLNAALDIDPQLMESAIQQKVILATPNSLVALLKTVAFGWHQEALNEGAEQVRDLATQLHTRLVTFNVHLAKMGNSLSSAVSNYNKAVGSLERSVLPSARRFSDLGIRTKNELEELQMIDDQPRQPNNLLSEDVTKDD